MKTRIGGLIAAAALLASANAAEGQDRSRTRGFHLGVHGVSSSIQLDEEGSGEAENGLGFGAGIGFGFGEHVGLVLRADRSSIEYAGDEDGEYDLTTADLGVRYSFSDASRSLRPYVEGGLSAVVVEDEVFDDGDLYDVKLGGGQLYIAGGLEYFATRNLGLDVGMALGKGRLTEAMVDGESTDEFEDLDITTIRFNLGIKLHL